MSTYAIFLNQPSEHAWDTIKEEPAYPQDSSSAGYILPPDKGAALPLLPPVRGEAGRGVERKRPGAPSLRHFR